MSVETATLHDPHGTTTDDDDTAGDDDPSGADSSGDGAGADPCDVDPAVLGGGYEVVYESVEDLDVSVVCGDPGLSEPGSIDLLDPRVDDFQVYVYRPALAGGAWPPGARPAVFFAPGNGQNIVVADDDPTPSCTRRSSAHSRRKASSCSRRSRRLIHRAGRTTGTRRSAPRCSRARCCSPSARIRAAGRKRATTGSRRSRSCPGTAAAARPTNGSGTLPVTASFDLATTTVLETRPTVSIGIPSTRPCPSTVALAATASDVDGDLLPVRWEVDGVRIAPTTTSLPFTRAHTFRAIARDARGATTVATKSVTCQ